jgi:ferredoxin
MGATVVIARADFDRLLRALRDRGYSVIGPTVSEGAIVLEEIETATDLPVGWTDEQEAGRYRLQRRDDEALFGYSLGPQSWKREQLPAQITVWRSAPDGDGGLSTFEDAPPGPGPLAFLGVRSCELHAMGILGNVLASGPEPVRPELDPFVIAVQCGQAGATCFCVSMDTGPVANAGFDLALTELLADGPHRFLVEVGSERGAEVLGAIPHQPAEEAERTQAATIYERTAATMGRELDTDGLKELLYRNLEHPRWDEVAERCLTCGNCTMVCPTCFCTTVEDVTDLAGTVERRQRWDSCFTVDYSYIHGGAVRGSTRSRYRQWMTHKLATWHDQFGSSGCVGCGRCITWCPVGIDLTEEALAIREHDGEGHAAD